MRVRLDDGGAEQTFDDGRVIPCPHAAPGIGARGMSG